MRHIIISLINARKLKLYVNSILPVKSELPLDSIGRRRVKPLRSFSFFDGGRPVLLRPRIKGKIMSST